MAAEERVPLGHFQYLGGLAARAQYHLQLMLALLIYAYADGIFSSCRIERATHHDIGMRFVAANLYSDHDMIATFRRSNCTAIDAAFLNVLELAREMGFMRLDTVSIDGTKINANASKYRSIRYDRAKELREKLATDIVTLMERTEMADATEVNHEALPYDLARREALEGKTGRNLCAAGRGGPSAGQGRPARI